MEGDDFAGRGTDAGRGSGSAGLLLAAAVGSISPSAVAILFVNDEIAHPAQDFSFEVAMRGSGLLGSVEAVGGKPLSAIELLNFRIRWM